MLEDALDQRRQAQVGEPDRALKAPGRIGLGLEDVGDRRLRSPGWVAGTPAALSCGVNRVA